MMSHFHRAAISMIRPERVRLTKKILSRMEWSPDRIKTYQEGKLRKIIDHCWRTVPFYRQKWKGCLDDPRDIRYVEDLAQLPLLTKDEVRNNFQQIVSTDPSIKMVDARTGGSTGKPIIFKMTPYDEELSWAQMYTGWAWAGYSIGDPFLVVGGESVGVGLGDKRSLKDRIMNRWATSGSNITKQRVESLVKQSYFHNLRFIYGYPNAIRELCERLDEMGVRPHRLVGVVCTAEVMRGEVRRRIAEILETDCILDQYGLNDGGLHACEDSRQDGLYVSFHRGLLELLDENNSVINENGITGKAVATSLTNYAMPFIRYDVGDQIHWHESEGFSPSINWRRIGKVDGRTGDVIFLGSGQSIAMPGLTLVMRWYEGLRQYQFVQTGQNEVIARLELEPTASASLEDTTTFLRQRISDEIKWTVEWGAPELTANGKLLIIRNEWLRAMSLDRPPGF